MSLFLRKKRANIKVEMKWFHDPWETKIVHNRSIESIIQCDGCKDDACEDFRLTIVDNDGNPVPGEDVLTKHGLGNNLRFI